MDGAYEGVGVDEGEGRRGKAVRECKWWGLLVDYCCELGSFYVLSFVSTRASIHFISCSPVPSPLLGIWRGSTEWREGVGGETLKLFRLLFLFSFLFEIVLFLKE
jgi:hypothetical protein